MLKFLQLSGFKTYLAGLGLIGLGVYQITEGKLEEGIATISAGLAAIGIGHKMDKASGPAPPRPE